MNRLHSTPLFSRLSALLTLVLLVLGGTSFPALGDEHPFEEVQLSNLHRIHQVWPLRVGSCPGLETGLLVLSSEGISPHQIKHVTWMPCGAALRPEDPSIVRRQVGNDVVLVDVAEIPGRTGVQLIQVTARGLTVESLEPTGESNPIQVLVPHGLPFAPRARDVSRIEIVADWEATGRPMALVPGLRGAWLLSFDGAAPRELRMPIVADYLTYEPFFPRVIWKQMISETRWPALARIDDNGDGRPDLFVFSRWAIWVFHVGEKGLPPKPSRKLDFRPFDEEAERRHQATGFSYFAGDLDGDAQADLILNTSGGGITKGQSTTRLHLGGAAGAQLGDTPDGLRETQGGFAGIELIDVNRDGVPELLETTIEFSVLKLVGLLLTGETAIELRVLEPDSTSPDGFRTRFEDDIGLKLDLSENRLNGLVPALGDWNGDGQLDLFIAKGSDAIQFRMGSADPDKPLFGRGVGKQPLPLVSGETRVADLDGDRLDDLIVFEFGAKGVPLVLLKNRGLLPGTGAGIRAATP